MSSQAESADHSTHVGGRARRAVASILMISLIGLGIYFMSVECKIPLHYSMGLYLGYLVSIAVLLAIIAGRLFRQHRVTEYKFDFGTMLMIVSLLAIPLGVSGGLIELAQHFSGDFIKEGASQIKILIAGVFYFLMFPVFLVTEAVLHWYRLVQKRTRSRD